MYQYDRFHVLKDLRECLPKDSQELAMACKASGSNDMEKLLSVVTAAWEQSKDPKRREKLEKLKNNLADNSRYIEDYRIRLKKAGYKVPADWRGMGAAESNVTKRQSEGELGQKKGYRQF